MAAATARDVRTPAVEVGPLANMVGYALRRAQLAVFDDVIANFADLELRPAQYSVLVLLGKSPGLKQSDVAAALGIQRANFVVLFDGLERRGLARRLSTPNDRRSYALYLTEAGEKVLARANELESRHEARLDAKLGPGGREQLLALLSKLAARD
ncbi:MAG: MarR family transcriptional regulator [Hyphomonadaceae bacterium]|nr:MarR family transcriptional regulator [Hyphomonadaceae bacterium]